MNKFATIAALESELKEVETAMCFAMRSWESFAESQELFAQRGEILRELQRVGQP